MTLRAAWYVSRIGMSRRAVMMAVAAVWGWGALASHVAWAWDDFGHMEVAAVAYASLTPKTKARVARLLALNPRYASWIVGAAASERPRAAFMRAATWADSIKADATYDGKNDAASALTAGQNVGYGDRFPHAYWHYVDQAFSPDGTTLAPPTAPNVATQIPLLRAALAAPTTPDELKSYDLVWLLHLVGDVHQPLHCVARFDAADRDGDRGGNAVKVTGNAQPPVCDDPRYCPFGPPPDLHAFVDTIEGSGYATAPALAAAARLPKAPARAAAVLDEHAWLAEGLELARTQLYVGPIGVGDGPFVVTPAYEAATSALGKQRIALGGARLANLLNEALGR
jgi:hypothetical protein